MSDIGERVKKIVVEHLGVEAEKVTENASFIDDLGADSLDTVELVMKMSRRQGRLWRCAFENIENGTESVHLQHVLHYLARYTHRVAISNHRLVAVTDDSVSFRWKDYRHGSHIRTLTVDVDEFLRRFLLHVLPKRFVRIRYFGFLAPRCRTRELAQCRQALAVVPTPPNEPCVAFTPRPSWPCPRCGAPMRIVERLTARQLFLEALLVDVFHDTS